MEEILDVDSWSEFIKIAEKFDVGRVGRTEYAFRGQSEYTWELRPSLVRNLKKHKIYKLELHNLENHLEKTFKSQFLNHLPNYRIRSEMSVLESWFLMQHYGAPTRLLDWTRSIYVATYFAVIESPDKDGAIWAVNMMKLGDNVLPSSDDPKKKKSLIKDFFQNFSNEKKSTIHFMDHGNKTDRMIAQQGLYSVCRNIDNDHDEIIEDAIKDAKKNKEESFHKIKIPKEQKLEFLRKLYFMNISSNSLFPGLDGLGRSISELAKLWNT